MLNRTAWFAAGLLAGLPVARATDLFQVSATGGGQTITAGASNVINLVGDAAGSKNEFAPLGSTNFSAGLNYAGINNAVQLNQSFDTAGNKIINLRVPSTGLNRTFSSANGNLGDQIKDFLKKDGLAALTEFQSVAGQKSIAGTVDGNPLAATALLGDSGYAQFALQRTPFEFDGSRYDVSAGQSETRIWADGGVLRADGVNGNYVDLNIASEVHFNDFIGLSLTSPLRYENIDGASIFMGGAVLGLPITFIRGHGENSISWQVTPAGHAALVGSADFASGGLIYGGQIDSSLSYTTNGLILTLADQVGYYRGANVDIAGYDFNTSLDQWLFKNGVQATKNFGNFFIDASATWSNFLRNAFVDGYLTPEAGVGLRFGRGHSSGLRVAYQGNFGSHYNTNGGTVTLFFTQ